MDYDINDHRHRFYAWAAATAARQSPKCRFRVKTGVNLIESNLSEAKENMSLRDIALTPENLPSPDELDDEHEKWRYALCDIAQNKEGLSNFSHGVAAKLINCYFKGVFICGGYINHSKVVGLHPLLTVYC